MSQLAYMTCITSAEYEMIIFCSQLALLRIHAAHMRKALLLLSVACYSNEAKLKAAALDLRSLRKGQTSCVGCQLMSGVLEKVIFGTCAPDSTPCLAHDVNPPFLIGGQLLTFSC